MSYADEQNFHDVTPHRIKVTSLGEINDYGRQDPDPATERTYRCLIQAGDSITKSAQGVTVGSSMTGWVLATPVDKNTPMVIHETDTIEVMLPAGKGERPLAGVTEYYAEDGTLHNMIVRFS